MTIRGRTWSARTIATVAGFAAVLATGSTLTVAALTGTAAQTLYVSPSGNDSAACTQLAPCATFGRAYAVAISGDTVEVTAGTYPEQCFAGGSTGNCGQPASTKQVTFHGQPGNIVRKLHVGSPGLVFDGINVDAGGGKPYGAAYEDRGAGVTFRNGSIGNVADEKGVYGGAGAVFDNVRFHDVVMTSAGEQAGVHNECLYAIDAQDMVLTNSTFVNCSVMDVFFTSGTWYNAPHYDHVTVEGNTFGASRFPNSVCCHYYGFVVGSTGAPFPPDDRWTIRDNYFEPTSSVSAENHVFTNSTVCGNTGNAPADWQAACSEPPPTTMTATTATTVTTATAATTGTTGTTSTQTPAYHPACEPICDSLIADYEAKISQADAVLRDSSLPWKTRVQQATAILES